MIFIDTGYLLALADSADELYSRAQAWSRVMHEPLVLTEYIVVETMNALSDPADRPFAHRLIAYIQGAANYEIAVVTHDLFLDGLDLHRQRADKHWSLTDCVSFLVMQQRGIQRALAYDHHFEQAGFEALLRRDPS